MGVASRVLDNEADVVFVEGVVVFFQAFMVVVVVGAVVVFVEGVVVFFEAVMFVVVVGAVVVFVD